MPSTIQASNAKSRAILAFGKFQGAYESWCALLEGGVPDANIIAAMQLIENHMILECSAVAVPLNVPEAAGVNDNILPGPNTNVKTEDDHVQALPQPFEATHVPQIEVQGEIKIEAAQPAPEDLLHSSESSDPEVEQDGDGAIQPVAAAPPAAPPVASTSTQNAASSSSTSANQAAGPSVPQLARAPNFNPIRRGLKRHPAYDADGMKELCKPAGKRKARALDETHRELHGRGLTDNEKAQKRALDELERDYEKTKDRRPSPPKKMRYFHTGSSVNNTQFPNPHSSGSATILEHHNIEHPAPATAGAGPSTHPTMRRTRDAAQRQRQTPEERPKDRKKNGADKRSKGT